MPKRKYESIQYVQVEGSKGMYWHENGQESTPAEGEPFNRIIHGDSQLELAKYPVDCIDLIFTSPPYADSRKKTYGGIHPEN